MIEKLSVSQQAPRISVGASGQRQQGGQREPAETTRTLVARPVADAEADAVAVGGTAIQQAAPVGLTRNKRRAAPSVSPPPRGGGRRTAAALGALSRKCGFATLLDPRGA